MLTLVPIRFAGGQALRALNGCLLLALSALAHAANPAANILFVHGQVNVIGENGKARPAQKGGEVFAHDKVTTAAASSAQLRFTDGALVALRPGTEYRIDDYKIDPNNPKNEAQKTSLIKGGLRAITGAIGQRTPANVSFSTPVATMGIRGTVIALIYVPPGGLPELPNVAPGLYAIVERGQAELSNPAGSLSIPAGSIAFVPNGQSAPIFSPGHINLFGDHGRTPPSTQEIDKTENTSQAGQGADNTPTGNSSSFMQVSGTEAASFLAQQNVVLVPVETAPQAATEQKATEQASQETPTKPTTPTTPTPTEPTTPTTPTPTEPTTPTTPTPTEPTTPTTPTPTEPTTPTTPTPTEPTTPTTPTPTEPTTPTTPTPTEPTTPTTPTPTTPSTPPGTLSVVAAGAGTTSSTDGTPSATLAYQSSQVIATKISNGAGTTLQANSGATAQNVGSATLSDGTPVYWGRWAAGTYTLTSGGSTADNSSDFHYMLGGNLINIGGITNLGLTGIYKYSFQGGSGFSMDAGKSLTLNSSGSTVLVDFSNQRAAADLSFTYTETTTSLGRPLRNGTTPITSTTTTAFELTGSDTLDTLTSSAGLNLTQTGSNTSFSGWIRSQFSGNSAQGMSSQIEVRGYADTPSAFTAQGTALFTQGSAYTPHDLVFSTSSANNKNLLTPVAGESAGADVSFNYEPLGSVQNSGYLMVGSSTTSYAPTYEATWGYWKPSDYKYKYTTDSWSTENTGTQVLHFISGSPNFTASLPTSGSIAYSLSASGPSTLTNNAGEVQGSILSDSKITLDFGQSTSAINLKVSHNSIESTLTGSSDISTLTNGEKIKLTDSGGSFTGGNSGSAVANSNWLQSQMIGKDYDRSALISLLHLSTGSAEGDVWGTALFTLDLISLSNLTVGTITGHPQLWSTDSKYYVGQSFGNNKTLSSTAGNYRTGFVMPADYWVGNTLADAVAGNTSTDSPVHYLYYSPTMPTNLPLEGAFIYPLAGGGSLYDNGGVHRAGLSPQSNVIVNFNSSTMTAELAVEAQNGSASSSYEAALTGTANLNDAAGMKNVASISLTGTGAYTSGTLKGQLDGGSGENLPAIITLQSATAGTSPLIGGAAFTQSDLPDNYSLANELNKTRETLSTATEASTSLVYAVQTGNALNAGSRTVGGSTVDWGYWDAGNIKTGSMGNNAYVTASEGIHYIRSQGGFTGPLPTTGTSTYNFAGGVLGVAANAASIASTSNISVNFADPTNANAVQVNLDITKSGDHRFTGASALDTLTSTAGLGLSTTSNAAFAETGHTLNGKFVGSNAEGLATIIKLIEVNGAKLNGAALFTK